MNDHLLAIAAAVIAVATLLCARVLQHLHRHCPDTRPGCQCDRGLLRWYAQGFDRPVRLSQALVMTSAALLIASFATHASPILIVSFAVLTMFGYLPSHYAAAHQRRIRCAMSRSAEAAANKLENAS